MTTRFRLYSFVNHIYMSPVQWGIQTAHCVSTLMSSVGPSHYHEIDTWAVDEPTIIVCQGGNVGMLTALYEKLKPLTDTIDLPIVKFHEDMESLGGIITAVAVLVPEEMFDVKFVKDGEDSYYVYAEYGTNQVIHRSEIPHGGSNPVYELIDIIKTARLA